MEKTEYTNELFGFTAEQVQLERRLALREFISELLESILKKIHLSEDTKELSKEKIAESCELMMDSFNNHLEDLEPLDANLFTVPEHILLPDDYAFGQKISKKNLENLESEVEKAKETLLENCVTITKMNRELECQEEQIKPLMADHEKMLDEMEGACSDLQKEMQKLIRLRQELHDYENS